MSLSDSHSNGPQFSKIIVIFCLIIMIFGIIAAVVAGAIFGISENIIITIIGAVGTLGVTSVVWLLKKSQTENTIKIYTSAYKDIVQFKKENNEDSSELSDNIENNLLNKLNSSIDESLNDATSLIEKQDIL